MGRDLPPVEEHEHNGYQVLNRSGVGLKMSLHVSPKPGERLQPIYLLNHNSALIYSNKTRILTSFVISVNTLV